MSYNIKIIFLENCDFSKKSLKLLQDNNIKYELVEIDHMNKDKFKTDIISTFPQIYLTKQNNVGHLLLGGYNELNYAIKLFKNIDNKDVFNKNKKQFMSENINWSKKATLRLIELIN